MSDRYIIEVSLTDYGWQWRVDSPRQLPIVAQGGPNPLDPLSIEGALGAAENALLTHHRTKDPS
jgi:hypothetical protein